MVELAYRWQRRFNGLGNSFWAFPDSKTKWEETNLMDEICKNCGHAFKWHESSGWYAWWCDAPGSCACDIYIPPTVDLPAKSTVQNKEEKETPEGLDFWRNN